MRIFDSPEAFHAAQGDPLGPSSWHTIDQEQINRFAQATGDFQRIHVDPQQAASGPFGSTIAHGYLTLSLLPMLTHQYYSVDARMIVNYGLKRVRFVTPVPVDSRVRARSVISDVLDIDGGVQVTLSSSMERPAPTVRPAWPRPSPGSSSEFDQGAAAHGQ